MFRNRGEQNTGAGFEHVAAAENPEKKLSPEKREIMDKAGEGRMQILKEAIAAQLKDIAQSPILHKLTNVLPVVGEAAMLAKTVRGKEGERTLSKSEKFTYLLIVSSSAAATALLASGEWGLGAGLRAFSDTILHLDNLPTYLETAATKTQEINPRLATILLAAAQFVIAKRADLSRMKEIFDSSLISLNLEETK